MWVWRVDKGSRVQESAPFFCAKILFGNRLSNTPTHTGEHGYVGWELDVLGLWDVKRLKKMIERGQIHFNDPPFPRGEEK